MGDTSSEEVTLSQIDELAKDLFHKADATGLWSCADHGVQLYFRKLAARALQQSYTKFAAGL